MRFLVAIAAVLALLVVLFNPAHQVIEASALWMATLTALLSGLAIFIGVATLWSALRQARGASLNRSIKRCARRLQRHAGLLSAASESLKALSTVCALGKPELVPVNTLELHRRLIESVYLAVLRERTDADTVSHDAALGEVENILRRVQDGLESKLEGSDHSSVLELQGLARELNQKAELFRQAASLMVRGQEKDRKFLP